MKNPICHMEIPAEQLDSLLEFYTRLFEWEFTKASPYMDYYMAGEPGTGITVAIMPKQAPEHVPTYYVLVESVDATIQKAVSLGACNIVPKMAVPGQGWFAVLLDPQKNCLGLWQTDPSAA